MPEQPCISLTDQTTAWCERAESALRAPPDGCEACIQLAREGVLLRRQWDVEEPDGELRRDLLRRLPAVQDLAQRGLSERCGDSARLGVDDALRLTSYDRDVFNELVEQLVQDDLYLINLINNHSLKPHVVAFAVECFRDDLHWLGTQVAAVDGNRGVDFLGRILLEQESLQREMDTLEDGTHRRHRWHPGLMSRGTKTTVRRDEQAREVRLVDDLQSSARRLRGTALLRQVEALLEHPEPEATDVEGWFLQWQSASRLEIRLDDAAIDEAAEGGTSLRNEGREPDGGKSESSPGPPRPSPRLWDEPPDHKTPLASGAEARSAVEGLRQRAIDGWKRVIGLLDEAGRAGALRAAAGELNDATAESMAFLEDMSLRRAVNSLEILQDDVGECRRAVRSEPDAGVRKLLARVRVSLYRGGRQLSGELQERRLAQRMEGLFGHAFVAGLERLILLLLIMFVVVLVVEVPLLRWEAARAGVAELPLDQSRIVPVLAWLDLGICMVFLVEFFLKFSLVKRHGLYLWRNWFTGLLPAIPIGFLFYISHHPTLAEDAEWLVLLRLLRLPRVARWIRIAQPVLRVGRLIGFVIRASDRLARQLAPLLNRNLLLFERAAVIVHEPEHHRRLAVLRERFYHRATELIAELPIASRCNLVRSRMEDLTAMLSARRTGPLESVVASTEHISSREIPLEALIARLLSATPAGISGRIGRGTAHSVTRWCRAMDIALIRRLPLVRDLVTAAHLPSPYDTTARVANRIGLLLNQLLDRVYWVADLYGTLTAPQLVDSLGQYLVKRTERPARRLVMIGLALLVVSYLAHIVPVIDHSGAPKVLQRLFGTPLIVMGVLCMIPLLLGHWFRRIAGEASDFYSRVAEAQYLGGTKQLKQRLAARQHALLEQRVLLPEEFLRHAAVDPSAHGDPLDALRQTVDRLWQDYLDGAPFHQSDRGVSDQLLGNLVLVSLREDRLQFGRRERAGLKRLDLANERFSLRGPHLWFHFIARSVSQHSAKLVADYGAHALPLARAATASDEDVVDYLHWLARRLGKPLERIELPEAFAERRRRLPKDLPKESPHGTVRRFHGNDFTAIHFLSADAALADDISNRYGGLIADLMRRDRRDNVRRICRTYPFHRWPRDIRMINPLALYQRHLAGGRILLLPWTLCVGAARGLIWGVRAVARIVREVLNPDIAQATSLGENDPYEVAVRKIHRMRKPLFLECLRMRADFDPEYVGCLLPGVPSMSAAGSGKPGNGTATQLDEDLAAISAGWPERRQYRQIASLRRQQLLEFRRWLLRLDLGNPPPDAMRAIAIAYVIDYRDVRTTLEAVRRVEKALAELDDLGEVSRRWWSPRTWWIRIRHAHRMEHLWNQPTLRSTESSKRETLWRLVRQRQGKLLKAVRHLTDTKRVDDPIAHAEGILANVVRDPAPWTRQLVVLRSVQTLNVLDLNTYCELVAELGEYDVHLRHDPPEEV